jgi:hypothetical protein
MTRNSSFVVTLAVVAALALLILFQPGGAFAQAGNSNAGGNGQAGQVMGSNQTMDGSHHDQMHADGAGQHGSGSLGHHGTGHGMMSMAGRGNHTHTGGMMGSGMMGTGAMQHGQMTGMDECPLSGADGEACPYHDEGTTGE